MSRVIRFSSRIIGRSHPAGQQEQHAHQFPNATGPRVYIGTYTRRRTVPRQLFFSYESNPYRSGNVARQWRLVPNIPLGVFTFRVRLRRSPVLALGTHEDGSSPRQDNTPFKTDGRTDNRWKSSSPYTQTVRQRPFSGVLHVFSSSVAILRQYSL